MKTLISTTTGSISSQMILIHCGDYAGFFCEEAYELLSQVAEMPEFDSCQWSDIMFDSKGNVYAIWAEGELTSQNSFCQYIQLDRKDCPRAFEEMESKMNN